MEQEQTTGQSSDSISIGNMLPSAGGCWFDIQHITFARHPCYQWLLCHQC